MQVSCFPYPFPARVVLHAACGFATAGSGPAQVLLSEAAGHTASSASLRLHVTLNPTVATAWQVRATPLAVASLLLQADACN